MILSFTCSETEGLWKGEKCRAFAHIRPQALRKLAVLDATKSLDDLRVPNGNRLEALKGDRKGQYSIRINDQYRLCFRWTKDGMEEVEIVDYH